jgi:hypothetical protein
MAYIKIIWRVFYIVSTISFICGAFFFSYSSRVLLNNLETTKNGILDIFHSAANFCLYYAIVIIFNFIFIKIKK